MSKYTEKIPRSSTNKYGNIDPGDEIVISGMAGRFPDSDTVQHLADNLYNKVDLISDDFRRWKLDHPEIPQRTGKINNIEKFDAVFFGVHFKQAHAMDPMCRMVMEHAYEAVIDAGLNPKQLRGTKTGVFIGACFSESEKTWFYEKLQVNGFGITGCNRGMLANRISYWFGIHGPSYTVDSACSSSLLAMESAYRAIRDGECDAAIVGGCNLCLHPYVSLQFSRLGVLSPDGTCRSFDKDAKGYTRSETVAVILLQKAKDARRVYATVVHTKTNSDGFKEQGITFPSSTWQKALFSDFYQECGIPPSTVDFLETHGTGTRVGDPEEANAIDSVFTPGRTAPLKIGSVKSNLGHSEPASGICSITKILIAMHNKLIPPNLHYKSPREGIKALEEGSLEVVTEPTPWDGGYAGVNSFGFGGSNVHVLLKSCSKKKINNGAPVDDIPRVVAVSGRTEEAVASFLDDITARPVDAEYIRLFHDIHAEEIPGHLYRGYAIVGRKDNQSPIKEIQHCSGVSRQIWFVFSGMGSQWPGMGIDLMRFPAFAEAIRKCDVVLKPRGLDIVDIITSTDKTIFDNILHSFVGIAAVQIGLCDLLKSVGIVPDRLIGHSVGELGCAYADGCFTAEQMILAAYSRGLASIETKLIYGSMAAVGLGYSDIKNICPSDITVACHNGPDSCTISGPAESITAFVAKLQERKIFAKEVLCSNIAYHSQYIAPAGEKLLAYLRDVIKDPKPRSEKWLSTSVPQSEWSTPAAQLSSAEYHTNNLLKSVLFEETARLIPKDAVTIEVAPHGLLQAILKRSLQPSVSNIALTKRGHKCNSEFFLQALGKLYNTGLQPQLARLYPEIEFPVSQGTPMISHLVKWEHSEDWYVTSYKLQEKIILGERTVSISMADDDYDFMLGHVIDGRNLVPATGYLTLIWETLAMMRGELYSEVPVVFEDVKFLRATTIPAEGKIELTLMIQKGSGRFEVVEGGAAVVTGMIRGMSKSADEKVNPDLLCQIDEDEEMTSKDVYKVLRLRGYQYSGMFKAIQSMSVSGRKGHIEWQNNWVTFMDNMLQMSILRNDTDSLFVPTGIEKLVIDTTMHQNQLREMANSDTKSFEVRAYEELGVIAAGGIEIRGMRATAIARRKPKGEPVLEEYKFAVNREFVKVSLREAIAMCVHLALENVLAVKFKTIEFVHDNEIVAVEDLVSPLIAKILGDLPLVQNSPYVIADPTRFAEDTLPANITVTEMKKIPQDVELLLAIGCNLLSDSKGSAINQVLNIMPGSGFLLLRENEDCDLTLAPRYGFDVVLEKHVDSQLIVLLKKKLNTSKRYEVVRVNNNEFSWIENVKNALNSATENNDQHFRLIVVGEKEQDSGLLGFVNCLRKEPGGELVRGVFIQDPNAPDFSMANPLYANQMQLDLAINVLLEGNVWGTYRHSPLPPREQKLVPHAYLSQTIRGDLSSLRWIEGSINPADPDNELVYISYASLNFRDIMVASGRLTDESFVKTRILEQCAFGMEFSGVDKHGQRVMGFGWKVGNSASRCMSNLCIADKYLLWKVPNNWSLEEAATVPAVYVTCYASLYAKGNMKKGDKVLIHAGSGAVGQAAINLALHEGCEVFTTVGTPEKRKFIRETFPSIDDDHIGNSRDTSFEQMVLRQTNGRGVDIVLNSLSEKKLLASVRCLAHGGRFLEIGKVDLFADNPLGMYTFLREITFSSILLDNLFHSPLPRKQEVWNLLNDGIKSGAVKPLVRTIFGRDEVEKAFRFMFAGKHIGKVMIKVREEDAPKNALFLAHPRYYCMDAKSYVIFGGLGGFGLELADWLVLRGSRKLVLVSRSGIKNGYQRRRIEQWKSYGVNVLIVSGKDVTNRKDVESILKMAMNLGPIDGVFNLAVNLKDAMWMNQTPENFGKSFEAKAWLTKILDDLTRKVCPDLRHFVVFSSVSCGRGNPGQTNYGMSNSMMERICEKRVEDGLAGLAIQWGAVGDVGLVADMQDKDEEVVIGGTLQQKILSCLEELDGFLLQNRPIVASMVVAEKRSGEFGIRSIVEAVSHIMGVKDLKTLSQHTSLAELGMDSMMAVEIKQTLEHEHEIFLTPQDVRMLTFAKLSELSEKQSVKTTKKMTTVDSSDIQFSIRLLGNDSHYSKICLELPTKAEEGKSEVFLLPGIEGSPVIFEKLIPYMKCPVTTLQVDLHSDVHDSVENMASYLLPHILERSKGRRMFTIVGFSFGSLIAIELARALEAQGRLCKVMLIDGAPEQLMSIKVDYLGITNDEILQDKVLMSVLGSDAFEDNMKIMEEMQKCKTWDEKFDTFIARLPTTKSLIGLSIENQKAIFEAISNRLRAIDRYNVMNPRPINSPITLLKPTQQVIALPEEDYGLHKWTRDKVEVHYVQGNHMTILENNKVATAINGEFLEEPESFKANLLGDRNVLAPILGERPKER